MTAMNIQYQCETCHHWFPANPNIAPMHKCLACQEMLEFKRGSGRDEGQSHIEYGPCSRCSSQTEYFSLPDGSHTTQCPECNRAYSSSSY